MIEHYYIYSLSRIYFIIDLQVDQNIEDFEEEDDFQAQLQSSYQFKVNSVDLAKLKAIRTKKLNKKRASLFEAMGIPIEVDNKSHKKKICFAKQNTPSVAVTSNKSDALGNRI
jgi:hypothetical protein